MTNYLRKDYNKDPLYNAGVTFLRSMLFLLILMTAAVTYRFTYKPYPLESEGLQKITVTTLEKSVSHTYSIGRRVHVHYHLEAVNDVTKHKYSQTITAAEYRTLKEGQTYSKPVYKTRAGRFISWAGITDVKKAQKLYYSRFPDSEILLCRTIIVILGLLALANLAIAIGLIRKGNFNTKKSAVVKSAVSYEEIMQAEHEFERSK